MSHRVLKTAAPTPRCYISDLSDALDNTLQSVMHAVSEMMTERDYCYKKKKKNSGVEKRLSIFEKNDDGRGDDAGVGYSYR